ncbi:MAG: class B sortase [Clostridia bacterium]|nr:class B sortase [Clostridia bacterium]
MKGKINKNILLNVVLVLSVLVLLFCGVQIVRSLVDYRRAGDKYDQLGDDMEDIINGTTASATTAAPVSDPAATSVEEPPETTAPAPVVREEYREMAERLHTLKEQYPDLFGWIYIKFGEDQVINLPVMKGDDNNYYISHAYDGTESKSGAIFADYRNTDRRIDLNQNLIFYGHNMNNSSMFALVSSRYKQEELFQSVPIVFYSMEGKYTFNVFSIYNAKAGEDYDRIGFASGSLKDYCLEKQLRSFFTKNLEFDGSETILTLVTCTNYATDGRIIVHGVLDGYDSFYD